MGPFLITMIILGSCWFSMLILYGIKACRNYHMRHVNRSIEMTARCVHPERTFTVPPVTTAIPPLADPSPSSNSPTDAQKDHNRWVEEMQFINMMCH